MNCNNICPYFHFVSGATITGGNLVLTFSDTPTVVSPTRFCFRFGNGVTLPTGYETLPIVATINGTNIPLWNRYGNVMLGSDLKLNQCNGVCTRFVYRGYVGSQTVENVTTLHLLVANAPKSLCKCGG